MESLLFRNVSQVFGSLWILTDLTQVLKNVNQQAPSETLQSGLRGFGIVTLLLIET